MQDNEVELHPGKMLVSTTDNQTVKIVMVAATHLIFSLSRISPARQGRKTLLARLLHICKPYANIRSEKLNTKKDRSIHYDVTIIIYTMLSSTTMSLCHLLSHDFIANNIGKPVGLSKNTSSALKANIIDRHKHHE